MILWIVLTLFGLLILHELSHALVAKLVGFRVHKLSLAFSPVPHFFVLVSYDKRDSSLKKIFFMLAGSIMTSICFLGMIYFDFFKLDFLIYAYAFQIVLETNPFYSDYSIIFHSDLNQDSNDESFTSGSSTLRWYLHLLGWLVIIVLMLKFIIEFTVIGKLVDWI